MAAMATAGCRVLQTLFDQLFPIPNRLDFAQRHCASLKLLQNWSPLLGWHSYDLAIKA